MVQVCADATDAATGEREMRALQEAGRLHHRAVKRLLTLTRDALPAQTPPDIVAQPAWEWMMAPPTQG